MSRKHGIFGGMPGRVFPTKQRHSSEVASTTTLRQNLAHDAFALDKLILLHSVGQWREPLWCRPSFF